MTLLIFVLTLFLMGYGVVHIRMLSMNCLKILVSLLFLVFVI